VHLCIISASLFVNGLIRLRCAFLFPNAGVGSRLEALYEQVQVVVDVHGYVDLSITE